LRRRGATICNVPMGERIEALQKRICGALLFISDKKSNEQLEKEIKIPFHLYPIMSSEFFR
jgi:hypothetical protein